MRFQLAKDMNAMKKLLYVTLPFLASCAALQEAVAGKEDQIAEQAGSVAGAIATGASGGNVAIGAGVATVVTAAVAYFLKKKKPAA